MTEVVVGTKKGLFVFEGDPGGEFKLTARAFEGDPVDSALRDPGSSRLLAATSSPYYGPKIWYADHPSDQWTQATGVVLPAGGDDALEQIWAIDSGEDSLYAGGSPPALFESRDHGASWELNAGLWEHPTRHLWQPGMGGSCVNSIAPWPGDPNRVAIAIQAAGVWLTDDHGVTWRHGNRGISAEYHPQDMPTEPIDLCVHRIARAQKRPERLFMQFHGGVYRSDDAGESWTDIRAGLPADFGFPVVLDPADPDSAFVIPLTAASDRTTPDGHMRVYETRDAGASWSPLTNGLPQDHAYLNVLRRAFDRTGEGPALELYFGTTTGEVFGSGDAGNSWSTVAFRLPPVSSVTATR